MDGWSEIRGKIMGPKFEEFVCVSTDFDRLVSSAECIPADCDKNSPGVISGRLSANDGAGCAELTR